MSYIFIAASLITFIGWLYQSFQISRGLKTRQIRIRGFLKHFNAGELDELNPQIRLWFILFFANFFSILIYMIIEFWQSDYNFTIALFPFLWHYMLFRFFLWEKSDLTEET